MCVFLLIICSEKINVDFLKDKMYLIPQASPHSIHLRFHCKLSLGYQSLIEHCLIIFISKHLLFILIFL